MKDQIFLMRIEDAPCPDRAFSNLSAQQGSFLFESLSPFTKSSRYSFIGTGPVRIFSSTSGLVQMDDRTVIDNPTTSLKNFASLVNKLPKDNYLPFCGGLVGFANSNWGLECRKIPTTKQTNTNLPDCYFAIHDTIYTYDHLENFAYITSLGLNPDLTQDLTLAKKRTYELYTLIMDAPKLTVKNALQKMDGSKESAVPITTSPWEVYLGLKQNYNVPYATFINNGLYQIISFSPDVALKGTTKDVEVRSSKGIFKQTELASERGRQLASIVQLVRTSESSLNKLERIELNKFCQASSIQFTNKSTIQTFDDSFIITTEVKGRKRKDFDLVDFLGHFLTLPIKTDLTLTDTEALGLTNNNLIGYISTNDNFCFNITHNPIVIKDSMAYFS